MIKQPFLFLLGVSSIVGCGGIAVLDDGQGGDGSTGNTSATRAASGSKTATTTVGTSVQNSAVVGTPGAQIVPTLTSAELFGNCQPGDVDPDPLLGQLEISYDNTGASPGATSIVSAQLAISNPMEGWVFPLALDPTSSGVVAANGSTSVSHAKVKTMGDSSFVCNLCSVNGVVTVVYDTGRQTSIETAVSCAF